jgi:hypothetical protein
VSVYQFRSNKGTIARLQTKGTTLFRVTGTARGPRGFPGVDGVSPAPPNFTGENIELTGVYPDYSLKVRNIETVNNVKDFGATGDGTTDDTAAIQAAIEDGRLTTGAVIYFPRGLYIISDQLNVYSYMTLRGEGDGPGSGSGGGSGVGVSTIRQTTANKHGIHGEDVIDFGMEGLLVDGTGAGTGNGLNLVRLYHGDCRYISVRNCTFQNFYDGVVMDLAIVSNLERVVSYNNQNHGFKIYSSGGGASTSLAFTACWADTNGADGWHIDTSVYCTLVGCASDRNGGSGYLVNNSQSFSMMSCGSENNTGAAFKVAGASYNVTAISCWNYLNNGLGFYVTDSSQNISVIGFHENTPGGSATASIKVDSGSNVTLIGYFVSTAVSLATNSTTILNDGSGKVTLPSSLITSLFARANDFELQNTAGSFAVNAHYDSGWKYIKDGAAFLINADGTGGMYFYTSSSGTAGDAIAFTERMHITASSVAMPALKVAGGTPGVGKVLTSDADGNATWQAATGGFTNPMTTSGDIIYGGASGVATRLAKGSDGNVLTLASGIPSWAAPTTGGDASTKHLFFCR